MKKPEFIEMSLVTKSCSNCGWRVGGNRKEWVSCAVRDMMRSEGGIVRGECWYPAGTIKVLDEKVVG